MNERYDFTKIEKKWQNYWEKNQLFKTTEDESKEKYYVLEMFPYPSGKLHMGHVRNYSIGDVVARFKKMDGYNVLHPMGFDSFGLPAENAAIKHGTHPSKWTWDNIHEMEEQLKELGLSYDWDREVATCHEDYYKWMQWIFIQFYKKGLAYKKENPVNWCPSCQTVLANEQVVEGACERCKTPVTKKNLSQWYLKITDYADRLLENLDNGKLDGWPNKVRVMQKNWIGRSYGCEVDFEMKDSDEKLTVFTTRVDTIYGTTFMVLAPEYPTVLENVKGTEYEQPVLEYIDKVKHMNEIERTSTSNEKTGVFIGKYAINPFTHKEMPIYIADYVLMGYGTGAVMGVPAHDQRDFDFATKFGIDIIPVVDPQDPEVDVNNLTQACAASGIMINSGEITGMKSADAIPYMIDKAEKEGLGQRKVNYKLRDWLISRQRYWGCPIPMIYCEECGWVPEKEENLPVKLPTDVEFTGKGESPIATSKTFKDCTCPRCGKKAAREVDTMDTFLDSSWYFLRYTDPHNDEALASPEALKYWMPVDWYNGGMEHTTLHLLYSRFWHKFLYDEKVVPCPEPYQKRTSHGMILGENGEKMSKSRGNVVNPDDIVRDYGADTLRTYEMFIGAFDLSASWSEDGVKGCRRFLERVWKLQDIMTGEEAYSKDLETKMHQTIKKVSSDFENLKYNTAIAAMMALINEFYKKNSITKGEYKTLLLLLNPVAPHITEELWQNIGGEGYVYQQTWPEYDEAKTVEQTVEIAVQINGKTKGTLAIGKDDAKEDVIAKAKETIADKLTGTIIKEIYVPGRIVNIVMK